jgi:phosphoribosylamine---glycine ligase
VKALVIGSGAREHALVWKFSTSKRISGLYCLPGNTGTAELGENIPGINVNDVDSIIAACEKRKINLVFIGPEAPLAEGLADSIAAAGINVVSPLKEAALLESSKVFSKRFMVRHNIPTAESREFDTYNDFAARIKSGSGTRVVKKNGLAAGKGVLESDNEAVLLDFGKSITESDSLLVEEYLRGYEISIFALFDGKHYLLFPNCADFKKAGTNDTGPNTGGMGAICPVPGPDRTLLKTVEEQIVAPTFEGIQADGIPYRGFLYFGLMITESGPKLLEYNVRLGDPEAQVLLPLIESDFGNLMDAVAEQSLDRFPLRIADISAVGVVVAAGGYPGAYTTGMPVGPLPENQYRKKYVFHASTETDGAGNIITGGGRCFTAVGLHKEILEARRIAYTTAEQVRFEGAWFREDIGNKFLF